MTTGLILKDGSNVVRTETNPFVWDLWQLQTALITYPVVTVAGCPTVYTVTDIDTERTPIPTSVMKIPVTGLDRIEGVYRDTKNYGSRHYFYVRTVIKNMNNDNIII